MGNCQAVEAAALVIQHPSGKRERMYWQVSASDIMKMNPGHYVSLIIPLPVGADKNSDDKTLQFTRVKLLRPTDTLVLGRAYRLITTQEVMKVLREKKYTKAKKNQLRLAEKLNSDPVIQSSSCEGEAAGRSEAMNTPQERHKQRQGSTNISKGRLSASWRPSLQSISEAGS